MKKRLLLAFVLLSCSASAFAAAARTGDTVCVPHQDDDCDASSGSAAAPGTVRPANATTTTTVATPKITTPARRNRTDSVRTSTMRFQSYLPGMFR